MAANSHVGLLSQGTLRKGRVVKCRSAVLGFMLERQPRKLAESVVRIFKERQPISGHEANLSVEKGKQVARRSALGANNGCSIWHGAPGESNRIASGAGSLSNHDNIHNLLTRAWQMCDDSLDHSTCGRMRVAILPVVLPVLPAAGETPGS